MKVKNKIYSMVDSCYETKTPSSMKRRRLKREKPRPRDDTFGKKNRPGVYLEFSKQLQSNQNNFSHTLITHSNGPTATNSSSSKPVQFQNELEQMQCHLLSESRQPSNSIVQGLAQDSSRLSQYLNLPEMVYDTLNSNSNPPPQLERKIQEPAVVLPLVVNPVAAHARSSRQPVPILRPAANHPPSIYMDTLSGKPLNKSSSAVPRPLVLLEEKEKQEQEKPQKQEQEISSPVSLVSRRLRHARAKEVLATDQVAEDLKQIKHFVPLELIYAHGQGRFSSMKEQHVFEYLQRTLQRMSRQRLVLALERWVDVTKIERLAFAVQMTSRIQSCVRHFQFRERHFRHQRKRSHERAWQRQLLRRMATSRDDAAHKIRRWLLARVLRARAQRSAALSNAATTVCRWYTRLHNRWLVTLNLEQQRRQREAATRIQAQVRRISAARQRRLRERIRVFELRQVERQAKSDERRSALRYVGAALRIQQWWRASVHVRNAKYRELSQKRRCRVKAATTIQSLVRTFLAIRFCHRWKLERRQALARLQGWVRQGQSQVLVQTLRRLASKKKKSPRERTTPRVATSSALTSRSAKRIMSTKILLHLNPHHSNSNSNSKSNKAKTRTSDQLEVLVSHLQALYRGRKVRRRLRAKEELARTRARAETRARVLLGLTKLQAQVRGIRGRAWYWQQRRHEGATVIQRCWRGSVARRAFQRLVKALVLVRVLERKWNDRQTLRRFRLEREVVTKIQSVVRTYLSTCESARRRDRSYARWEIRTLGRVEFQQHTLVRMGNVLWRFQFRFRMDVRQDQERRRRRRRSGGGDGEEKEHTVLRYFFLSDDDRDHDYRWLYGEWQDLFLQLCHWGRKKTKPDGSLSAASLDQSRFLRFFRELPKFVDSSRVSVQNIDILFSKVKNVKSRTITYAQFMTALHMILRLKFSPEDPHDDDEAATSASDLHGTRDEGGRIEGYFVQFLHDYIRHTKFGQKTWQSLQASTRVHLEWVTQKIQRWIRSILRHRESLLEAIRSHEHARALEEHRLISKIQSQWRGFSNRRAVRKLLSHLIVKYIDGDSGMSFYVNTRTGSSRWTKPLCLGPEACHVTIELPKSGQAYIVWCVHHMRQSKTQVVATIFCDVCEEPLCQECFDRAHQSRQVMASHLGTPIHSCRICGLQTATKCCQQCGDGTWMYCDLCFSHFHSSSSSSSSSSSKDEIPAAHHHHYHHRALDLVMMCSECSSRAAQWKCSDCHAIYCHGCFDDYHRKGRRQRHAVTYLPFYTTSVERAQSLREEKRVDLAQRAALADAARQERLERDERKFLESVTIIQARFRAKRARQDGRAYMRMVRQTQHAIRQRQEDDAVRQTWNYKMLDKIGMSPELPSDTLREKQLRFERKTGRLSGGGGAAKKQASSSLSFLENPNQKTSAIAAVLASVNEIPHWCEYNKLVVILSGEYKGITASVLSIKTTKSTGHVQVFIHDGNLSLSLPLFHLRERLSDEEERILANKVLHLSKQVFTTVSGASTKLQDAKHQMSLRAVEALEKKEIQKVLNVMEKEEFESIVEMAWKYVPQATIDALRTPASGSEEDDHTSTKTKKKKPEEDAQEEDDENTMIWWNVVTNKTRMKKPKGVIEFEKLTDDVAKRDILQLMHKSEKKLRKLLKVNYLFDHGARGRRNALDNTIQTRRSIGSAYKFFTIMYPVAAEALAAMATAENDRQAGRVISRATLAAMKKMSKTDGQVVRDMNGREMETLARVLTQWEDTEAYAVLLNLMASSIIEEKRDTLETIANARTDRRAQAQVIELAEMSVVARVERREGIMSRLKQKEEEEWGM